jgi:hypothetical protein
MKMSRNKWKNAVNSLNQSPELSRVILGYDLLTGKVPVTIDGGEDND